MSSNELIRVLQDILPYTAVYRLILPYTAVYPHPVDAILKRFQSLRSIREVAPAHFLISTLAIGRMTRHKEIRLKNAGYAPNTIYGNVHCSRSSCQKSKSSIRTDKYKLNRYSRQRSMSLSWFEEDVSDGNTTSKQEREHIANESSEQHSNPKLMRRCTTLAGDSNVQYVDSKLMKKNVEESTLQTAESNTQFTDSKFMTKDTATSQGVVRAPHRVSPLTQIEVNTNHAFNITSNPTNIVEVVVNQGKQGNECTSSQQRESVLEILRAAVEASEFEYDICDGKNITEVEDPPLIHTTVQTESLTPYQLKIINQKKQAAMDLRRKLQRQHAYQGHSSSQQTSVQHRQTLPHSNTQNSCKTWKEGEIGTAVVAYVDGGENGALSEAQLKRIELSRQQAILRRRQREMMNKLESHQ